MAILKLYGGKLTTCTRRVGTVLHELKVPFELIEVDLFKGEQKTPEYLEKQPFGQVPYIDDNGFILYESRAICRYVAAKHPESGLIPAEPKANALFEQAAAAEVANFDPSASKAGLEYFKQKYFGMTPDQALVDTELAALEKKLDAYEVILSRHRYVAGDTLTLADLFHLPYAWLVTLGGSDIMTRRPNVARWYQELTSRPSWLAFVDGAKTTKTY
ncbi:glutathione S-transferase [Mycena metata]|uniref:glutathione transferase n=1 Tax=Mycena metata TaxID=1033252 RepID=A0AAD7JAG1_9AGAR|nr:glutathione S-transferase [Mycena metata]